MKRKGISFRQLDILKSKRTTLINMTLINKKH